VPGVIARDYKPGTESFPFKSGESYVDGLPFPVTSEVTERGRERYEIFCAMCHGSQGEGGGPVVQRGFPPPQSFLTDEVRHHPTGFYFDVISNGYREMGRYGFQLSERDRWAIVAYIRQLQARSAAEARAP
jgi:mono/diheme cytochrome c family protein